jgi:hypothetical protein
LIAKFKAEQENDNLKISGEDLSFLHEKLSEIKTACTTFNIYAVKSALNDLRQMKWQDDIEAVLDNISLYILHSDFNKALEIAENAAAKISV